jgi:molybdenum cofactor guanylyltransferase
VTRAAAIVLCGGRSSRMGAPKAWLPFGDELMLQRVVRIALEAVERVVVVAAPGQDVPPLPSDVRIVRDEVEGRGPLGGLAAGLAALEGAADVIYLSSCDVPLLKPEFVRCVVEALEEPTPPTPLPEGKGVNSGGASCDSSDVIESEGSGSPLPFRGGGLGGVGFFSAAVPRVGDRLHPLAAAYRVAVLPVVRESLTADRLRLTDLFGLVSTRVIEAEELLGADPDLASLRNVNSPDEYESALRFSASIEENA